MRRTKTFDRRPNGEVDDFDRYRLFSRLTDPKGFSSMLEELPDDVIQICEVAKKQTIHHNLLNYYGISNIKSKGMSRVWPPRMPDLLKALQEREPHNLKDDRKPEQRIIGACILESYLLAGMLRFRNVPARIRAGYFKDIRANHSHILRFWEGVQRAKHLSDEPLKNPEKWRAEVDEFTKKQNEINHHIEHWICEYWDDKEKEWRLLDANNTFLKAHSNIDVGFRLPKEHFEHAFEAWKKMRRDPHFLSDKYAEEPQDGRSHIRSQMLQDFFSLLNHDLAGYEFPRETWSFIKGKKYEELTTKELDELDALASLVSQLPTVEELVAFYRRAETLRNETAETDPYSFIASPNTIIKRNGSSQVASKCL
jgi:hypothetical protein